MTERALPIDYRAFFAASPDLLCAVGFDGRFVDVNPAWGRAVGRGAEDLRGRPAADFIHPHDRAAFGEAMERIRGAGSEGAVYHGRFTRADGSSRWLSLWGAAVPEAETIVATARDVTERRAELRHFRALLEVTTDFVLIASLRGEVLFVNPAGLALVGRAGQDPAALRAEDFLPPRLHEDHERITAEAIASGSWSGEAELWHASGELIPASLVMALIRDGRGEPEAYGMIARDLRGRRRGEVHARKLRALIDSTSDFISIGDVGGMITYVNPAGLAMIGRSDEDPRSLKPLDVLTDESAEHFKNTIRAIVVRDGFWAGELALKHKDGSAIPVSMVILFIKGEDGAPASIGSIARDLTEQKAMEAALRQAIRAMSTPIIQVWEGVLALPVIGIVDGARASQMMESMLEAIVKTRGRAAIIDLTGVSTIDAPTVTHLFSMAAGASLLGSRLYVSGISAKVASTIAGLGIDLGRLHAFGTLEEALRHAIASMGRAG
jgi:PAS domain S-box-containing protein